MSPQEIIADWERHFSYNGKNLFVEKLRAEGLRDHQIAAVIEAIESTCRYCWNSDYPCHCWNDE